MTEKRKVSEIFAAVLEQKPTAQTAFLKTVCGDDKLLLKEIEELLSEYHAAQAENFLLSPALEIEAAHFADGEEEEIDPRIGQIFGHYEIIEEIGAGGMGAIYLARRIDDFEKQVAVKIIKRGMDTKAILRRFRQERQILAALEHPNIARLLDGGTTADGLPFLVMEYVEGSPINVFCDENNLNLEQRLKLFREICAAVSYAHQNLVIHRDLKPSNILVTKSGEPKLLDFGIAKLLNQDSENFETATEIQAMTPEYASPEQMRGEKLTTSTDIYSLGVILYELLTNNRPYKFRTRRPDEIARVICEQEPEKPSSAIGSEFGVRNSTPENKTNPKSALPNPKSLRGDLDNIILKSLRKEASRRYASVEQFSEDVRRHLANLPVFARKDTFDYRAGKFVERNRIGVTALAVIFLMLAGGIFLIARQARIAEREREKAERRAENLRKLSNSFAIELHSAILNLPGSLPARELLLSRAVEQLNALAAESDGNPVLQDQLAEAFYNLGELPAISIADAEQNYRKALNIYENLSAAEPSNIRCRMQIAKGFGKLADLQKVRGDLSGAVSLTQKRIDILKPIAADAASPDESLENLFHAYYESAGYAYTLGNAEDSLNNLQSATEIIGELRRREPDKEEYKRLQYDTNSIRAADFAYLGNYEKAVAELQEAVRECSEMARKYPNDMRFRYELWAFNHRLSIIFEQNADREAALATSQTALNIMENLRKKSPDDTGYQRNTAFSNLALGQILVNRQQFEKATPYLNRALNLSEKLVAADPERGESVQDLARIYQFLGEASLARGNRRKALDYFRQADALFEKILEHNSQNAILRRDYAEFLAQFGDALIKSANPDERREAKEFYTRSLEVWQDLQMKNALGAADAARPAKIEQKLSRTEIVAAK